jgi:signal transduction histidine kinase/ActR/RegA family two-component response regulator
MTGDSKVRESNPLLNALQSLIEGDFSPRPKPGERMEEPLAAAFNAVAARYQAMQDQLQRFRREMEQVEYQNREVEQAKAALEEKAAQLALSSRYKSEFLANMSHELRTPLNSLLVLAQLLAENNSNNLTPKQVEYAQTIYASGHDLLALINDILDLAKVESGTISINIDTERFSTLRDYVERTFRQIAIDKGLQFTVRLAEDLPPSLQTDAKRLQQILKNLLSNAFKFTSRGSVLLDVTLAKSGWSTGQASLASTDEVVAFSVTDTGIGIPADKQRIIFEAFQQADGTTSREFGGTGLGLSISSELARLLGGEIQVQSAPGEGSTFTLYVPLALQDAATRREPDAAADSERSDRRFGERRGAPVRSTPGTTAKPEERSNEILEIEPEERKALSGKKVLIVDDDIRNIFALTSALEREGLIVLHAENGLDAMEALNRHPEISLILMDLMMPELDGYDTIRLIRGQKRFRDIPIIGVTARAMKGDRDKCLEAGASDYLAKPVNVQQLLYLMLVWLGLKDDRAVRRPQLESVRVSEGEALGSRRKVR